MSRSLLTSLLCFAAVACAGTDAPPPTGDAAAPIDDHARTPTADNAGAPSDMTAKPNTKTCDPLLGPDDVYVRHRGQGSHGAATTDVTLDLANGKLTGSSYKLGDDGNTPVPLKVDQVVPAEQLTALRTYLDKICATRRQVSGPEHAAPGGSTSLEIEHADGSSLFVTVGASNLEAGSIAAELTIDDWSGIWELWPTPQGKAQRE